MARMGLAAASVRLGRLSFCFRTSCQRRCLVHPRRGHSYAVSIQHRHHVPLCLGRSVLHPTLDSKEL